MMGFPSYSEFLNKCVICNAFAVFLQIDVKWRSSVKSVAVFISILLHVVDIFVFQAGTKKIGAKSTVCEEDISVLAELRSGKSVELLLRRLS